jgi:hypothetical protein
VARYLKVSKIALDSKQVKRKFLMIKFFKLLKSVLFFYLLVFMAAPLAHSEGTSSGGGGFAFSNSSDKLLDYGITKAVRDLQKIDPRCLNTALLRVGLPRVNVERMIDIIQGTRRNYSPEERTRINEKGRPEPLNFDWGNDSKGAYIEALRPFFDGFASFSPEQENPAMQINLTENRLLHEAYHHVVGESESKTRHFARVVSFGASHNRDCGSVVQYSLQTLSGEPYVLIRNWSLSFYAGGPTPSKEAPEALGIGFGGEYQSLIYQWTHGWLGESAPPKRTYDIRDKTIMDTLSARPYLVSTDSMGPDGKVKVWLEICGECLNVHSYPRMDTYSEVIDFSQISTEKPKVSVYRSGRGSLEGTTLTVEYGRLP